jgi:hypothetical protein
MPLFRRSTVILAKKEVTYNTDPTPTGAANAILVRNMSITPLDQEFESRDLIRSYMGNSENLPVRTHAIVEFEVEAVGSGALGTAPKWGPLLLACGFAETVTASTKVEYLPVSTAFDSITIYYNANGVRHKITGARGNVQIAITAKRIPVMRFRFLGNYNAAADATESSVAYTGWQQPLAANTTNTPTFSLHSVTPVVQELSIDVGNQIVPRELIGASSVLLTDRRVQGQVTIEANLVATKDWWTIARNATLAALQVIQGTAAGYKFQIDAPSVQITGPTYTDMDGVYMMQAGLVLVPTSSGNDEIKITSI